MRIILFIASMLLISCGSTQTTTEESQMSEVKQWVANKEFTIESDWAIPLGGSQVNLIGNSNFLTFKKDTVSAYLPFFGERHSGYSLDGGGIEFEGVPENLQTIYNQKKQSSILKFDISEKSEHYQVTVTLYNNKNSTISVNSSQRDVMRYNGEVEALPEEDE